MISHASRHEEIVDSWRMLGFMAHYRFPQIYKLDDEEFLAWDGELMAFMAARKSGDASEADLPMLDDGPAGASILEVVLDVRSGRIIQLYALEGYPGTLLDGVRTGTSYAQVRMYLTNRKQLELDWSNATVGGVIPGVPGVDLHFERDDGYSSRSFRSSALPGNWAFPASDEELRDRKLELVRVFPPGDESGGGLPL